MNGSPRRGLRLERPNRWQAGLNPNAATAKVEALLLHYRHPGLFSTVAGAGWFALASVCLRILAAGRVALLASAQYSIPRKPAPLGASFARYRA